MKKLHLEWALLPEGWRKDVLVTVVDHRIVSVEEEAKGPASGAIRISGCVLPGMANVHSHAFQHAMAGLTEYRTSEQDSFWTWRTLMYRFLETFSPVDIFTIGKKLYSEMLAGGYTTVGEFHYLLNRPDGSPYPEPNAMADRLIEAALEAGIRIGMIPVLYQRGGFDNSPLVGGQRRFGSTHGQFLEMLARLKETWGHHPHVRLGYALHSLRAVSIAEGQKTVAEADQILPRCPVHIHVAEQVREVDDCLAATGKRPVELLLDSFDVNSRWCLIHATHMNDEEVRRVVASGAVVGVCPTTEANLGDGFFPGAAYLHNDGKLAIGGDSHMAVDVRSELRVLECVQRLIHRRRAVLCNERESCGEYLYRRAAIGGGIACGFGPATIAPGSAAVFSRIAFEGGLSPERLLDKAIFAEGPSSIPITGFTA
jgi:formimidoylglutamate deiminase